MSERTPELADIILGTIGDRMAEVHTMLPGRIEKYDKDTQKAEVKPLLRRVQKTVDGEIDEVLPNIPGVPVVFPRSAGFKITFPVQAGDRCVLIFCERSIDAYQIGQGGQGGVTDPGVFQMHDLSDPVALLGWYPDPDAADPTDDTYMVLGKDGGGATIHIGDDEVTIYKAEGSEPLVHVADDQVNLYEKSAADFVALAQKVLDELDDVKADFQAFKSTSDTHTHAYTQATLPTPTPSLTTPPTSSPAGVPPITWPTPHTPQSVAAQKVKAT